MSDPRDRDVVLPWQFVLLGFLLFGALFAALFVGFALFPESSGMRGSFGRSVKTIGIPYLIAVAVITPFLIRGGRRQARKWKQDSPTDRTVDPHARRLSSIGRVREQSPAQGATIGWIAIVAGGTAAAFAMAAGRWTTGLIFLIPVIGGVQAVYHHSRR